MVNCNASEITAGYAVHNMASSRVVLRPGGNKSGCYTGSHLAIPSAGFGAIAFLAAYVVMACARQLSFFLSKQL